MLQNRKTLLFAMCVFVWVRARLNGFGPRYVSQQGLGFNISFKGCFLRIWVVCSTFHILTYTLGHMICVCREGLTRTFRSLLVTQLEKENDTKKNDKHLTLGSNQLTHTYTFSLINPVIKAVIGIKRKWQKLNVRIPWN